MPALPDTGALSRVSAALGVEVWICGPCGLDEAKKDPQGEQGFTGWIHPPRTLKPLCGFEN